MPTFVAFLRAVNVGKRTYPMADLRAALSDAGFEGVETHIQTGNVLLRTRLRSPSKVVDALEKAMLVDRGFEVPVVLLTPEELVGVRDEAVELAADLGGGTQLHGHYVALLAHPPEPRRARELEARSGPAEQIRVGARAVHLMLGTPFHEAKTGNAEVERHLGVATTRSLTVITKLAEKWGP